MYKELHELLVKMKISSLNDDRIVLTLNDDRIVLTKKELNMLMKFINEFEIKISGGNDE